ncbi:Alpha amylase catalytic region [Nostocoides australiense Ben110]|uniref:Alpha amylase catalytic region n=1 Tax=Nostocoides australiense Ben110 TaxID=1193182 RepID=W6JS11_9MICO|nr:glycoside hydrolase family 13 protein [Tetrasphaera australiensis]CCH71633.1 Alpha amylase catalytic region [Tetrasphaera australiensis Ben110]
MTVTVLDSRPIHARDRADASWWRHAVIYQIYPRSFADGDGNGIGDLPGARSRLPYLKALGVDAIWFSPFYRSPQADAGYDVADYRDVDSLFGTLADFEDLLSDANALGLKVIVDLVPNHTSDEHAWFQAALAAGPGSPERERYLFRDGKGAAGQTPPNNWKSVFGGPAWTRVIEPDGTPGQWYLHLFDVKQPDLNWEHPQVRAEFLDIIDFWLARGVAGFRVDVANALVKDQQLPDWDGFVDDDPRPTSDSPMWDKDGVHEIYRSWRALLNSYDNPERIMCAESWVNPPERGALYLREDEFHQAFNFDFLECAWRARDLRDVIAKSLHVNDAVDATTTWVLSNHDVVRHTSRLGLPVGPRRPNGIGADDPQPDARLGLRRAKAATLLMLGLPGSAYIYQGEELGLPDHTALPGEVRQDPTFMRTEGKEKGRDGCRIPLPWNATQPALGFSATGRTWLPQPPEYAALAADAQEDVAGSTLEFYRAAIGLRRDRALGLGSLAEVTSYGADVVAYVNGGAADTLVLVNLGADSVSLPDGAQVLLSSDALSPDGSVPTDTAVWARL